MGAYLAQPSKEKSQEEGESDWFRFGECTMQGWRTSQEVVYLIHISYIIVIEKNDKKFENSSGVEKRKLQGKKWKKFHSISFNRCR